MVFQPDILPGAKLTSKELNGIFRGQEQGGMRYSKSTRSLLLVTDQKKLSGASIYADEWIDGLLHYRGAGQRGDQSLEFAGNRRLMRAAEEDTAVFLVERTKKGEYRYLGPIERAGDPYRRNEVDADGAIRLVWVFPLRVTEAEAEAAIAQLSLAATSPSDDSAIPIPSAEALGVEVAVDNESALSHDHIQLLLLDMGARLGLDVWVANNDRGRIVDGKAFSSLPRMRDALPAQFDPPMMKIIQNIDVLWLRGNGIEAAFEIEHTTSVYSGLLRMSDLVTLYPNFHIRCYIVAPDTRESKVLQEITRPTFDSLRRPLRDFCGSISYSRLLVEAEMVRKYGSQLKPGFLQDVARFAEPSQMSASA